MRVLGICRSSFLDCAELKHPHPYPSPTSGRGDICVSLSTNGRGYLCVPLLQVGEDICDPSRARQERENVIPTIVFREFHQEFYSQCKD